jgi:hypothetical protein
MTPEDVDNLIEDWHTMSLDDYAELGCPSLYEYLGWTWEQYAHWVKTDQIPKTGE